MMKKRWCALGGAALLAGLVAVPAWATPSDEVPRGWILTGNRSEDFAVSVTREVRHDGPASAHLRCVKSRSEGFGSLAQRIAADDYRGKRLRLSAWIKGALAGDQWGGLWMRVDGAGPTLAFDNMQDRPIHGAQDFTRHEIVLDVPDEAVRIMFGALVVGGGEIWIDELSLEEVGDDVPVTQPTQLPRFEPVNLDFEEGTP